MLAGQKDCPEGQRAGSPGAGLPCEMNAWGDSGSLLRRGLPSIPHRLESHPPSKHLHGSPWPRPPSLASKRPYARHGTVAQPLLALPAVCHGQCCLWLCSGGPLCPNALTWLLLSPGRLSDIGEAFPSQHFPRGIIIPASTSVTPVGCGRLCGVCLFVGCCLHHHPAQCPAE